MVSTYLSYNIISRDMKAQLDRVAKQPEVSREDQYYQDNIGKVKTVDEFVGNYRLFAYAMKAYGLEDMTYAAAFMKKVLNSDLNDDKSFANLLTDNRYRKFAQAFQFTAATAVAQTSGQTDDLINHYKQSILDQADAVSTANSAFKTGIATVTSVDDLLNNEQLRTYALKAFSVDSPYWSKDFLTKVLTSDVNDPASYVNTLAIPDAGNYKAMAAAFNFNASGTLDTGVTAQDAAQTTSTIEAYTFSVPDRLTPAGADLNKAYFEANIGSVTDVDGLVNDARMLDYIKTAYGLDKLNLKSEFKNILTSDLADPNNYATTFGGANYEALTRDFNFNPDGSINGASAQTAAQTSVTSSQYMTRYDDADSVADEGLYTYYKSNIGSMDSVEELHGTGKVYNFILAAYGFDPNTTSAKVIDQTLESDLTDPKSFANMQKDKRYTDLAADFNFDAKGAKTAPLLAQSQQTMQQIASDYVVGMTRYDHTDQKDQATKDATAYTTGIQAVKTVSDFLSDRKLVDFVLQSKGIDPKTVDDDFMKKLFASDLSDPKSFANQQTDHRFIDIVSSFNFDAKGNIAQRDTGIQDHYGQMNTDYLYLQQTLETDTGEDSPGARLALYFKRMAPSINSAYDILGDTALLEVFRTAFELPPEMSTMAIDKQSTLVNKYLNLQDLQDPAKLDKFISRFTSMYDLANSTGQDPILSLFGSSSGGISADTLLAVAQLKY
ncbi:MAG: hypothetical protein JWM58_521 [Rhizobium sp.]|nr:hypothetical protein [Rhizobium sp.]